MGTTVADCLSFRPLSSFDIREMIVFLKPNLLQINSHANKEIFMEIYGFENQNEICRDTGYGIDCRLMDTRFAFHSPSNIVLLN